MLLIICKGCTQILCQNLSNRAEYQTQFHTSFILVSDQIFPDINHNFVWFGLYFIWAKLLLSCLYWDVKYWRTEKFGMFLEMKIRGLFLYRVLKRKVIHLNWKTLGLLFVEIMKRLWKHKFVQSDYLVNSWIQNINVLSYILFTTYKYYSK